MIKDNSSVDLIARVFTFLPRAFRRKRIAKRAFRFNNLARERGEREREREKERDDISDIFKVRQVHSMINHPA